VLLPVGPDWYAVEVAAVREVVILPDVTAVPTAGSPLIGLFNLRGEILPLFDTAALLGLGATPLGPWATIVSTANGPAGLIVSNVPESVELGPAESVERTGGATTFALGTRLATLIDVDRLLGDGRVGA